MALIGVSVGFSLYAPVVFLSYFFFFNSKYGIYKKKKKNPED